MELKRRLQKPSADILSFDEGFKTLLIKFVDLAATGLKTDAIADSACLASDSWQRLGQRHCPT